jgi:hypothetical protein
LTALVADPERVDDAVAVDELIAAFPPDLVDAVIRKTGREEQRSRSLPARTVVYCVLGLAAFPGRPYEAVMGTVADGLARAGGSVVPSPPTKAALTRARTRLGVDPLRVLFEESGAVEPHPVLRGPDGRRIVRLECRILEVPDTGGNRARLRGRGAVGADGLPRPEVQVSALVCSGSGTIVDATVGASAEGRVGVETLLLAGRGPGSLLVAGPDEFRYSLWDSAGRLGWNLLCEPGPRVTLCVEDELEDGTFLSVLHEHRDERRWGDGVPVRVVGAAVADAGGPPSTGPLLVTSLLDCSRSSPGELRRWYRTGREGPSPAVHPVGAGRLPSRLRSKDPELAVQEVFAHLCLARTAGSNPAGAFRWS